MDEIVTGLSWPDVDETEATLEGNALLKARAVAAATGFTVAGRRHGSRGHGPWWSARGPHRPVRRPKRYLSGQRREDACGTNGRG